MICSAVAPVVQADWKDVVALIPLKDAPEPEGVEEALPVNYEEAERH